MKHTLFFALLLCYSSIVFAQRNNSFGVGFNYNMPLAEPGVELRMEHILLSNLSVLPHLAYFPGFRNINELFLGANVNYFPFEKSKYKLKRSSSKFKPYVFVGAAYNNWINANPRVVSKLKSHNIIPQAGVGINSGGYILKGFLEVNYNILADEGVLKLGVLFSPSHLKVKKKIDCP